MTKRVDSIKDDIINFITSIDDYQRLSSIAFTIGLEGTPVAPKSIFDAESVRIVNAPPFNDLFIAQGSKKSSYRDLPPVDNEWEYSLDELLAAL
jgi:hypothetical protein